MPVPGNSLPLAGVKVIELGQLIAGPFAAKTLSDFGAEVIKIEAPDGGDPLRQRRKLHNGTSLWWYAQARTSLSRIRRPGWRRRGWGRTM